MTHFKVSHGPKKHPIFLELIFSKNLLPVGPFPQNSTTTTNYNFVSGHSMGGALAVHASLEGQIFGLIGLVVVDVVEGTAMDALSSMQSFLRSRPKCFPSIENAIEWSMKSGQVRNSDSARISMPGQLKNTNSNQCVAVEVPSTLIFSFGKNRQKNRLHYNPSNIPPFGIPVGKGDSFS